MRTRAVPARPTSSCTAPSPIVNPAFVHSTGLPPPSRVSGVARSTTRPSRSSRSAKHPARSASTSTSPSYHWSFSAPYIHTQLRSLPHHVSDCELPIPHDRTAMALFSAARSTSAPIPEFGCRTSRGGVRAARGVSSWLWFRCLRFPGAAWCKEAPDGGCFRVSVASHLPARIPIVGLTCAMGSVALLASDRRNSTSVSSRLAPGGCWVVVKKKVRFLLRCASAFGPFLIPLFGTEFYTR